MLVKHRKIQTQLQLVQMRVNINKVSVQVQERVVRLLLCGELWNKCGQVFRGFL